ncbi:hypothetical protein GCM10009745_67240 [Kribbella yunnanensis]|uniref:Uncharacterized protein n=1 Tax=Kribbella yunnanensis TaxID=190194 RepID=A0ABP4UTE2_9ACTN
MKVRRGIRIATVLALAAPALIAVAPGTASAYPQVCKAGEKWATVSGTKVTNAPTHMQGVSIAPGSNLTRTVTIKVDRTFSAGIDVTTEASAKAGVVLAKASVTVGAKLAVAGSRTTSKSITDTWTFPTPPRQRRYVVWSGTRVYGGRYSYHVCKPGGRSYTTESGPWRSYRTQWVGSSLCGARYPKGSMEYNAAVLGGC